MIEEASKQLNKMLSDYSKLNELNNKSFDETMKNIDELGNEEHTLFLKQSLIDAKDGKLDINQFIENSKKIKDAN